VTGALRGLSFISDANEARLSKQARSILLGSDESNSDQAINFLTPLTIDRLMVDRLLTAEDIAVANEKKVREDQATHKI
jgi:hypothetical protein